jgi:ComF family protein
VPKFQWPPNPLPEQDLGPPSTPGYWKTPLRTEPEPVNSEPPASVPTPLTSSPPHLFTSSPPSPLRHIESVFLGLTRPTFADRAAEVGWAPDNPATLCPRCALTIGPPEHSPHGCTHCHAEKLPWTHALRLGPYEGLLRQAIHEVKFSAWRRLGTDLGRLLGHQLQSVLTCTPRQVVVIPVPCTFRRRLTRGIDHTATLAKAVSRALGATYAPALTRQHRRPQVGLSNTDRRRNVAGTMSLRGYPRFNGLTIVLVDDVRTTGATMGEACKSLLKGLKARGQSPAQVWSCTLAVVEGDDHSQA